MAGKVIMAGEATLGTLSSVADQEILSMNLDKLKQVAQDGEEVLGIKVGKGI